MSQLKFVYIHRKPTGLIKEAAGGGGGGGYYPGNVAVSSILSVFGRFHNLKNWKYIHQNINSRCRIPGYSYFLLRNCVHFPSFLKCIWIHFRIQREKQINLLHKRASQTCFTSNAVHTSAWLVCTRHVQGLRCCDGIEREQACRQEETCTEKMVNAAVWLARTHKRYGGRPDWKRQGVPESGN